MFTTEAVVEDIQTRIALRSELQVIRNPQSSDGDTLIRSCDRTDEHRVPQPASLTWVNQSTLRRDAPCFHPQSGDCAYEDVNRESTEDGQDGSLQMECYTVGQDDYVPYLDPWFSTQHEDSWTHIGYMCDADTAGGFGFTEDGYPSTHEEYDPVADSAYAPCQESVSSSAWENQPMPMPIHVACLATSFPQLTGGLSQSEYQ